MTPVKYLACLASYMLSHAVVASSWPSLGLSSKCYPEVPQKCDREFISHHPDTLLPDSSALRFFLFTRKTAEPEMLHLCRGTLPRRTQYSAGRKTVVLVPGYAFGICEMAVYEVIKDEILKKEDANVILVDTREEFGLNYISAVASLSDVGKQIAHVLDNIKNQTGPNYLHLVGQSLGAHAAGIVGKNFPVQRITGIDPAGPLFPVGTPAEQMLHPSDADVVDVIHCNAGSLGIEYPVGHADFYVNGGSLQPNCSQSHGDVRSKSNVWIVLGTAVWPSACSHTACVEYFADTISGTEGEKWVARHCPSYEHFLGDQCGLDAPVASMGYHFGKSFVPGEPHRTYYLDVRP